MIDQVPNVLVVLSQGALDERIKRPEDWLRKEIAYSLAKNKRLIPVLVHGFSFTGVPPMPDDMERLRDFQSVIYHADAWDATLDRIESYLRR